MKLKIAFTLAILLTVAVVATVAYATTSLSKYDTNQDNQISHSEAVAGIEDYFDGEISRGEAVDIFLAHYARHALVTLSPTPARAVSVAVPIPGTPRITKVSPYEQSFTIEWSRPSGKIDGYQVAYREASGGEWDYQNRSQYTPNATIWKLHGVRLRDGVEYVVTVRAYNQTGPGKWSEIVRVIPSIPPTPIPAATPIPPSPTPIAPKHRGCYADYRRDSNGHFIFNPFTFTLINPHQPTQLWHDRQVSWEVRQILWFHKTSGTGKPVYLRWIALSIGQDGAWSLTYNAGHHWENPERVTTYDHGVVDINKGWNARNEISISREPLELYVNGVKTPLELGDARTHLPTATTGGRPYLEGNATIEGSC